MRASSTAKAIPSLLKLGGAGLSLSLLGMLPAGAHGLADAGLAGGATHPLLGIDHLLLLAAVGTTSALAAPVLLWLAAAAAVIGGVCGSLGANLPGSELLAALVITALGAALLRHLHRNQVGLGLLGTALTAAVAVHAMLHGLESSGQPGWWLGAALSSCLVVGMTHLGLQRLNPSLRRTVPGALVVASSVLAIAAAI